MKIFLFLSLGFFYISHCSSQVRIYELDSDTPGVDTKEFIELITPNPFTNLDSYVLVMYNGSNSGGDRSYIAIDLDGLTSDANGIVLLGTNDVSPVPDYIFSSNTIQNGADAIAIYSGTSDNFPEGTLATTANLIDALAYDTNDSDDDVLLELLGLQFQVNEGENGASAGNSIQLVGENSYRVDIPTPGLLNDGAGISYGLLSFNISENTYNEGDTIAVEVTSSIPVTQDTAISFTIDNGNFISDDYNGELSILLQSGTSQGSTILEIVDDTLDEGDEIARLRFNSLPTNFKRANDNIEIRIVDNDFTTAAWGTPTSPTYNQVTSTQPDHYYAAIDGKSDNQLKEALQQILSNNSIVRWQTYADVIDILKEADQSPLNSNKVWLMYTEQDRSKLDFQTSGGSNTGLWNREHTYPRSRGGYFSIADDDIADGKLIYGSTTADSLRHANSDAHGLRAVDGPENSARSNKDYGEYSGPVENQKSFYGDVARSIFYLSIRYNGLNIVSGNPSNTTVGSLGDLETLLEWHRNDPPDDFEMHRNNVIYQWQYNRNPFIDMPELVAYIWGDKIGEVWTNPLQLNNFYNAPILLYPNPSHDSIIVKAPSSGVFKIYSMSGSLLKTMNFEGDQPLFHELSPGVYVVEITSNTKKAFRKLIVN